MAGINGFANMKELATFITNHYNGFVSSGYGGKATEVGRPDIQINSINQLLRRFPFESLDGRGFAFLKRGGGVVSNVKTKPGLDEGIYIQLINSELEPYGNPSNQVLPIKEKYSRLYKMAWPEGGGGEPTSEYVLKDKYESEIKQRGEEEAAAAADSDDEDDAFGGGGSRNIVNKRRSSKRRSFKRRSSKRRSSKRRSSKRRSSKRRSSKRRSFKRR